MLSLLVPILVSYLVDTPRLSSCGVHTRTLHEHALAQLMKVGPQYPAHFRGVMATAPDMRTRLEAAVKNHQSMSASAAQLAANAANAALNGQPAKPTIKLKTNFGNFAG